MSENEARWRQADEIFDRALDLEPGERGAFVDRAAGGDLELRALVLRLLDHAEGEPGGFEPGRVLEGTFGRAVDRSLSSVPSLDGDRIGRYRVLRELGRGGMAVVLLAERVEGDFRQLVAVKLIQDRFPGPAEVARFERERQILADARHPNLARLVDGGTTDDGRPYLVMEYVEGEPIDAWCDRRRLDVRARIRLFVQVARAVEHAHRLLVVHRDIKPSNILVTEDGTVKLLDFGIARLLDDAGDSEQLTRTFERVMTPAYASPEQARGEPVTAASDVYQLGILLYLLLTGRWPYRSGVPTGPASLAVICEEPVTRPSSVVTGRRGERPRADARAAAESDPERLAAARRSTPRRLRQELAGDLDAILMTALRKEPERRYASVTRLVDDLRAVLDHRPVSARPDSLAYRAGRFLRRHAAASAVAVVGAAALAGLLGFHLVEVGRERDRARLEAAKATETARFLRSLFEVASPTRSRGESVTARELLEQGAERIETGLGGEPDLQAELMTLIGDVHRDLGLYDESKELLERAVAIRREHPGEGSLGLADALYHLGMTCEKLRDDELGREVLEEAIALRREALGEGHPEVARAEDALGVLLVPAGEPETARRLQAAAVAKLESALGPEHPDLGDALNHYATTLQDLREYQESLAVYERALAVFTGSLGSDHPKVAAVLVNMAYSARYAGQEERAEELYLEGLERVKAVYGEDHPNVGVVVNNLANLVRAQGRLDEAERLQLQTLELWRTALGPDHPRVTWSLNNLGLISRERGDHEEARRYFAESIAILERSFPPDHAELGTPLANLAQELISLGRPAEAIPVLVRSLAIRERVYGPEHSYLGDVLYHLGEACLATGDSRRAEAVFRRSAAVGRSDPDHRGHDVTRPVIGLARALAAQGRREEAVTVLRQEHEAAMPEDREKIEGALAGLEGPGASARQG